VNDIFKQIRGLQSHLIPEELASLKDAISIPFAELKKSLAPLHTALAPVRELQKTYAPLNKELESIRSAMHGVLADLVGAETVEDFVHYSRENSELAERYVKWATELADLSDQLVSAQNTRWSLPVFWLRLANVGHMRDEYDLESLREQDRAEGIDDVENDWTRAQDAAVTAIDCVLAVLSAEEWEVVRFLRDHEGHPWAGRHHRMIQKGGDRRPQHRVKRGKKDAKVEVRVRELAQLRDDLLKKNEGEVGFARALAGRIQVNARDLVAAITSAHGALYETQQEPAPDAARTDDS
jgi:hypothetical protein